MKISFIHLIYDSQQSDNSGKISGLISCTCSCLIIVCLFLFCACANTDKTARANDTITAVYTSEAMTIDGILSEKIWQKTQFILLLNNKTGNGISEKADQTKVRTCFNDSCFYIFFECNDADIWGHYTERDQHLWEEEAVEVFIDTDDERYNYIEIEVSPRNVLFDSYIIDPQNIDIAATKTFDLPGIQTSVFVKGTLENRDDKDESWNVEIAIPFSDLNNREKYASPDSLWRINFYRINRDRNKEPAGYAWSPTFGRFHKPSAFGVLKFAE